MIDTILWDLDGTLTKSDPGIARSVAYALEKMNLPPLSEKELRSFVGPPLKESFQKTVHLNAADTEEAIRLYREYYEAGGMFENELMPGMEELLQKLSAAGVKMILATGKPEKYARMIIEHFGLEKYFTDLCGAEMHSRLEKKEVIAYALEKNHLTVDEHIVMVGDRHYDMLGAAAFGIPAIGVLFGYGSREELESSGAAEIVANADELYEALKKR